MTAPSLPFLTFSVSVLVLTTRPASFRGKNPSALRGGGPQTGCRPALVCRPHTGLSGAVGVTFVEGPVVFPVRRAIVGASSL